MKPSISDQLLELRSYLYDYLLGDQSNQTYMHGKAFWTLPRDIVRSVADVSGALTKDDKVLEEKIAKLEANILLAQTTELLTPEVSEKALTKLDDIRKQLIKGK